MSPHISLWLEKTGLFEQCHPPPPRGSGVGDSGVIRYTDLMGFQGRLGIRRVRQRVSWG